MNQAKGFGAVRWVAERRYWDDWTVVAAAYKRRCLFVRGVAPA
jgi:hypothetical protein